MSPRGTDRYFAAGLETFPAAVAAAARAARDSAFDLCVHPATGQLLADLAAALPAAARVGETGTGTGAGVAWMASTAPPDAHIVSVEIDPGRATTARRVLEGDQRVTILEAGVEALWDHGPFDLLVLDGGPGSGKEGHEPISPRARLRPGGRIVIDDFTPTTEWPPRFGGELDRPPLHWLTHPDLDSEDHVVAPDMAVVVGRLRPTRRDRLVRSSVP